MPHPITLLKGLGLGAGLMYIFDPWQGRRRRARLGDQVTRLVNEASTFFERGQRDLGNRAYGVFAEARGWLTPDDANDTTIVARVRSALGHCCSRPRAIEVTCENGAVTLRGPVLAAEVDRLVSTIARVRGVREVVERLEVHVSPEGVEALQGARPFSEESRASNWTPAATMVVGTAGAVAGLALIRRSGLTLPALGLLGAAVVAASAEGDPLQTLQDWADRGLGWGRQILGDGSETDPEPLGTGTGPVQRTGSIVR